MSLKILESGGRVLEAAGEASAKGMRLRNFISCREQEVYKMLPININGLKHGNADIKARNN